MSGRVLRHETVKAAFGAYTGAQCPWCPAVLQAVRWDETGEPVPLSERLPRWFIPNRERATKFDPASAIR